MRSGALLSQKRHKKMRQIISVSDANIIKLGYESEFYRPNLVTHAFAGSFRRITKCLEQIDYNLNFTFNTAQKREVRAALSNTFGFGGHNACVVFKKYAE